MQKTETKSFKTEQPVKTNFFEVLSLLKSEKVKLMKDAYISKEDDWFFTEFFDFSPGRKAQIRDS